MRTNVVLYRWKQEEPKLIAESAKGVSPMWQDGDATVGQDAYGIDSSAHAFGQK